MITLTWMKTKFFACNVPFQALKCVKDADEEGGTWEFLF